MKALHSVAVVGLVFFQHLSTSSLNQLRFADPKSPIRKKYHSGNSRFRTSKSLYSNSFDRLTTTQIHENIHILEGLKNHHVSIFVHGIAKELKLAGH